MGSKVMRTCKDRARMDMLGSILARVCRLTSVVAIHVSSLCASSASRRHRVQGPSAVSQLASTNQLHVMFSAMHMCSQLHVLQMP